MQPTFRIDAGPFVDMLRNLERAAEPAARRVLNRGIRRVWTLTRRDAASRVGVRQKSIAGYRKFANAHGHTLESRVVVELRPLNPAKLDPHVVSASRGRYAKTGGGIVAARRYFGGAFLAGISRGARGTYVWKRAGPARFPILVQRIPWDAEGAAALEKAVHTVNAELPPLLLREIEARAQGVVPAGS